MKSSCMLLSNVAEDGGQSCSCGSNKYKSLSAMFTIMSDISGTLTEGTKSAASWFECSFEIVSSAYALPYLHFRQCSELSVYFPYMLLSKFDRHVDFTFVDLSNVCMIY